MMTALATVASVNPKAKGYQVELSCEQQTSCSSCSSQKSCGTGIVSKAFGNKTLFWQLSTKQPLQAGQVVEIGFPEKSLLWSASVVYIVPLLMLFVGALASQWILVPILNTGEGVTILMSGLFLFFGILLAKKLARKAENDSAQEVVLLRVLGEPIS
ncbi:SoxR reducing system RseC family protein [Vibrio sp. S4M6]|uniref:SoxR reducing system RseC family protein n=1 Tax=Vibrio sinus TaxID=2946865 RepID=UPI00202A3919|nr:SoxR reducing system RseC family protein [Vibrio sinus]MCL9781525.1 SoxR reducing system RseC family protein [Vibrio sinus]